MLRRNAWLLTAAFLILVFDARMSCADGPRDNLVDNVRQVPPPGLEVPAKDRAELTRGVEALGKKITALRKSLKKQPALLELLPDVQIFHNAVRYALTYNEFFKASEINQARKLLELGQLRAEQLGEGKTPWTTATGLVVRGYLSRIDGSVQPYGLVVPDTYQPQSPNQYRLDLWYHGRGETLSEVSFLGQRLGGRDRFKPANTFVLHPYGRYSNANHFAGETDTFEALEHAQRHYPIDDNRIVVRGFSMGGAACWHFAVHYAWRWAAAAPGAGFSETPEFLRTFQNEKLEPTWYQRKLWHMYDCNDYAINLYHCPTVAYSGEKDRQKQAADVMEAALAKVGMRMVHIIGKGMGHSYDAKSVAEINRRIDAIAAKGRDPLPHRIHFTTWTLRYPRMHWIIAEGLEEHWKRASIDAEIVDTSTVKIHTQNVAALTVTMPPGLCPLDNTHAVKVVIDGQPVTAQRVWSDRSWQSHWRKKGGKWAAVDSFDDGTLRKKPGLQGPIDDAFMDSFVMVSPTGKSNHSRVDAWVKQEFEHATTHWRRQFRGEAPVKADKEISDADIASKNLVLWGDPSSNKVLARIADKLPIRWIAREVKVGGKTYDATHHVPALIFPNPLNPEKYVVLNSSFTYREYDYLNNARQVPRLPDWAILDIDQKATSQRPAGIANAGFFDEQWRLQAPGK